MSNLSRSLCAAFAVLICYTLAHAEQGYLPVLVINTRNQPLAGATLSVGGDAEGAKTDPSGKARIRLADGTKPNSTVLIYLVTPPLDPEKKSPLDLVFIQPWDGYVLVPPYDNENKNFIKVVMAERGSRALLEYPDTARVLLSRLDAKANDRPNSNIQLSPEERKQAHLAEVAKDFGLTPAQADQMIQKWKETVEDDHDIGLVKFYAENYEEARKAFSDAKAKRITEFEQANIRVAESAFFEGRAYFRQTKFQDAIESYNEALHYRPNDTNIMSELAYAYEIVSQFEKAEPLLKQALDINEKTFGPFHEEVASSVEALGAFYLNRGDNKQGASQFERMVAIREKVKGPESLDVAHDLDNLAVAYIGINKFAEAEKSLRRALDIIEKISGRESPELAFTLNTFASLYDLVKDNVLEAERLLKRSTEVLRKAIETSQDKEKAKRNWGKDYAQATSYLGNIYLRQGRFARAEPLLKEALDYREMAGPLRPEDVDKLYVLADLYERLRNFAAAEKLYVRVLGIRENALGKEHQLIIPPLINLALVYEAQKKFTEAEELRMRVLKIAAKRGLESESQVLLNLARFYERQKKLGQAEDYYKRALARIEGATDSQPATVVHFVDALAGYYERQQKFVEAESNRKRILAIFEQASKNDSAQVAPALKMMAQFYGLQKRYDVAEDYYKRAEEVIEKSLGKDAIDLISHLSDRADFYETQERFAEAEQLYKRAVEITSKPGLSAYPTKGAALNQLANFYQRQKRYDQAEQLYKQAQAIIDNAKEATAVDKIVVLVNLGKSLLRANKYAEAEAIYNQSLLVVEKENGPEHPNVGVLRLMLAEVAKQRSKNGVAEDNYKRALSIFQQELGTEDPKVATCLESYAAFLRGLKRDSEAVTMENKAKQIRNSLKQVRDDEN